MSNKKRDDHVGPIFINTVSIRLTDAVGGSWVLVFDVNW